MLNTIVDVIGQGLPESAPSRVVSALRRPYSAVVLGSRWEGRVVYALFAPGGRRIPAVVVKADTNPDYQPRLYQEHQTLVRITADPAMEGLAPAPLGVHRCGDAVVMAQTALPGTPLNVVLRRRFRQGPGPGGRDHGRLLAWLDTFHGPGSDRTVLVEPQAVADGLRRALPAQAAGAGELFAWVERAGHGLGPLALPVRPLHGDLGPSNCFVHRGRLRVIDWEGGVEQGVPLAEAVVFLNHYARAVPGPDARLRDPLLSFREAFLGRGWLGELTWSTWGRVLGGLGVPAEAAEYLLVSTLVDLALGRAPTAHAARAGSRRNWSNLLAVYAAHRQGAGGPAGVDEHAGVVRA